MQSKQVSVQDTVKKTIVLNILPDYKLNAKAKDMLIDEIKKFDKGFYRQEILRYNLTVVSYEDIFKKRTLAELAPLAGGSLLGGILSLATGAALGYSLVVGIITGYLILPLFKLPKQDVAHDSYVEAKDNLERAIEKYLGDKIDRSDTGNIVFSKPSLIQTIWKSIDRELFWEKALYAFWPTLYRKYKMEQLYLVVNERFEEAETLLDNLNELVRSERIKFSAEEIENMLSKAPASLGRAEKFFWIAKKYPLYEKLINDLLEKELHNAIAESYTSTEGG